MNCPKHPDIELRRENAWKTGFCGKCARHYDMCTEVRHMAMCEKLKGHEGNHVDKRGQEWTEWCADSEKPMLTIPFILDFDDPYHR